MCVGCPRGRDGRTGKRIFYCSAIKNPLSFLQPAHRHCGQAQRRSSAPFPDGCNKNKDRISKKNNGGGSDYEYEKKRSCNAVKKGLQNLPHHAHSFQYLRREREKPALMKTRTNGKSHFGSPGYTFIITQAARTVNRAEAAGTRGRAGHLRRS